MAVINATRTQFGDNSVTVFTYETITTANTTGAPIQMAEYADRTIHVKGTFGAAATIVWEGSNDGVTYVTLTDPQGNALSKTAEAIETVMEVTRFARPRLASGGDGSTDIDVIVLLRRANPMRT